MLLPPKVRYFLLASLIIPFSLLNVFISFYFPSGPVLPDIEADDFFGEGAAAADDERVLDFSLHVPDARIQLFKEKLLASIAAAPRTLQGFRNGFNPAYLREMKSAIEAFDWIQHEHFLNTFHHQKTQIEGLDVHFVHQFFEPKKGQKRVPLLLIHGFGSSFWDFYKIAPILANPSRFGFDFGAGGGAQLSFEVIIPSLPSFGFSPAPSAGQFGSIQAARILGKLMDRLGHSKYFVHGNSALGSEIATILALQRRRTVAGIHLANPFVDINSDWVLWIKRTLAQKWPGLVDGVGENTTWPVDPDLSLTVERPDSIGLALSESPFLLTSVLLDRWAAGINHPDWRAHPQAGLQAHNTFDELLTEASIYWLPGHPHAALRFLHFSATDPARIIYRQMVTRTPTGLLITPRTHHVTQRFFYDHRYPDIRSFTSAPEGGEFVAVEQPNLLAKDIFSFVELILVNQK